MLDSIDMARRTSPKRTIGHSQKRLRRQLGQATRLQMARIFVGLDREIKSGICSTHPFKYTPTQVDDAFLELRSQQVGFPGATRFKARGVFEGSREESVVYEIIFFPDGKREPTYGAFQRNISGLAEDLREHFCQKSVLVTWDDGDRTQIEEFEA